MLGSTTDYADGFEAALDEIESLDSVPTPHEGMGEDFIDGWCVSAGLQLAWLSGRDAAEKGLSICPCAHDESQRYLGWDTEWLDGYWATVEAGYARCMEA